MGLAIGFLSGLSGIGGAVLLAPTLVLGLPAVGGPLLAGRTVTSLDMAQAFSAGIAATPVYWKARELDPALIRTMGSAAVVGGAMGAGVLRLIPARGYLLIFLGLTSLGLITLAMPAMARADRSAARSWAWPVLATSIGLCVTFFGSLAGSSGSFLLSPAANRLLGVPFRRAVGSVMTVVMAGAAANLAARMLLGPFPWLLAALVSVPAAQAARVGARVSVRAPVVLIRAALGILLLAASIMLCQKVLAG
ncbi:MAG: sulfite exporter TauE/SafE family protein [Clostridia bacterium]